MSLGAAAQWSKVAALLCSDTLLQLSTAEPSGDRVLIVRLDAIGDFVLWLDAAKALASHYKARSCTVTLVANALWASWAGDLTVFDEIIPVDVAQFGRSLSYRYRTGKLVRQLGCSVAINPTYSRHWLFDDSIIRISGAKSRIGSIGDRPLIKKWRRRLANRSYTQFVPASSSPLMELERNAEFVRNLCGIPFSASSPHLDTARAARIDSAFNAAVGEEPYYVVFPGASRRGKEWPVSSFAEVMNRLHHQTGWKGVICGGPGDITTANDLAARSSVPLLNWVGKTDLAQLTYILSRARLLLSNDTSAVHIAHACGVPSICLLGGGQYGRFLPYSIEPADRPPPRVVVHRMPCFGCDWNCIYKPSPQEPVPCIIRIGVDETWRAVNQALGAID